MNCLLYSVGCKESDRFGTNKPADTITTGKLKLLLWDTNPSRIRRMKEMHPCTFRNYLLGAFTAGYGTTTTEQAANIQ